MHICWRLHQILGASRGTCIFLSLKLEQYFTQLQNSKSFDIKNYFSWEPVLTYTIMIYHRMNFYPTNLWSQRQCSVDGHKKTFWGSKLKWATETLVLPPGPKLIWLIPLLRNHSRFFCQGTWKNTLWVHFKCILLHSRIFAVLVHWEILKKNGNWK